MFRRNLALISVAFVAALAGACSAGPDSAVAAEADCGVTIDRFKEMMVVEPSVIDDPRSSNALNGPWSFRHAIEGSMRAGENPSAFVSAWIDSWAETKQVNGFQTDRESRTDAIRSKLVCPWLHQRAANACDESCTVCAERTFDLAKAPFRLLAIANRTDLRTRPDATSPSGESRLVFALTKGPADDKASAPAPMTVIFEYALPESATPREWVEAWHHLGTHTSFDEAYKQELTQLTERFVAQGVSPKRPNGAALSQLRTNESEFNWIWQLREFQLDAAGALRIATTKNTPGESLNNSAALRAFVIANAEKIKNDTHVVPASMLAGSADQLIYRWQVPDVDEPTRLAFALATCNGCHSGESNTNTSVDTAFHVSPFRDGIAKLSPFVNNPAAPDRDDLGRREKLMKTALCEAKP